jgi:hypothetical protein
MNVKTAALSNIFYSNYLLVNSFVAVATDSNINRLKNCTKQLMLWLIE